MLNIPSDLMDHIRRAYAEEMNRCERGTVAIRSQADLNEMPSNKELLKWYYDLENRRRYYHDEPKLSKIQLRFIEMVCKDEPPKAPPQPEPTPQPQRRRGPHPLVTFTLGVFTGVVSLFGTVVAYSIYDDSKKRERRL